MNSKDILFTVGPVQMDKGILDVAGMPLPYFRTGQFSEMMLDVTQKVKRALYTNDDSEVIFLTASGTGGMEATVLNLFNKSDKLLVINGGSFGSRFMDICRVLEIPFESLELEAGKQLKVEQLEKFRNRSFTGLLINAHETSTGLLYDLKMMGEFCREENLVYVVDAIGSFAADEYYMDEWGIDATIISSQKGLGLAPGISIVTINQKVKKMIESQKINSLYFDFNHYIGDIKRGQTPFTPAVGVLLQLKYRLDQIEEMGGIKSLIVSTQNIANDFREKVKSLPFVIASESLSNTLTPLTPKNNKSAHEIFEYLKEHHRIIVNPNGGELKDKLIRVGHIGNLTTEDNDRLIHALMQMERDGLI